MGAAPLLSKMTVEDYFAFDDRSVDKHEYYRGEIFAMAGASLNHNQIVGNTVVEIGSFLKDSSCRVFPSDLKIQIDAASLFTYPDLSIICTEPEFYKDRKDTITNPVVIIEVLSESTYDYYKGKKFEFYRLIPSLKEYILISSEKVHVEQYLKQSERSWTFNEFVTKDAMLTVSTINQQIVLADLYRNISFE